MSNVSFERGPNNQNIHAKRNARNGKIEFLRFFFGAIIVIHHSHKFLGSDISPFLGGSLGVEFFFFVSGYLMMAHIEKKNRIGKPEHIGKETMQYVLKKWNSVLPESIVSWMIGFVILCLAEGRSVVSVISRFVDRIWEPLFLAMTGLGQIGINVVVWYISAMLLCMIILYPLLRQCHDITIYLIIPVTAFCIFGYFCRNLDHARGPTNWLGWTYKGVMRAFAELGIGSILYYVSQKIRSYDYTWLGQWLITLTENACYFAVVCYMYLFSASQHDFFFIMLLAIAVALTFSGSGIDCALFDNKIALSLGRFSVPLYFSHYCWARGLNKYISEAADIPFRLGMYITLSCITAAIVMYLANLIRKYIPILFLKAKPFLVKESEYIY